MNHFADKYLKPYIVENGYRNICEIGASLGENTEKMLSLDSITMTVIDPCFDADLLAKHHDGQRIKVLKGLSLDILPTLSEQFDCILIDGDHNWYTVYNELRLIEERKLLKTDGTIFFHDVGWPYGRRDMYFQPEVIPAEFTHPYEKKGIIYGQSELAESGGSNAEHYNAVFEGGTRNGVLTAVEDFVKERRDEYTFFYVEEEFGLGVLFKKGAAGESPSFNRWHRQAQYQHLRAKLHGVKRKVTDKLFRSAGS
jgi:SAM-dependent methyltransferase